MKNALLLRPFSSNDARALFFMSSHYLRQTMRNIDGDKRRQTEWPFCDESALLQALAAWHQTRVGRCAAAHAICAVEGVSERSAPATIGAIVVSAYDSRSRSAQLGTYIAPDWRNKGMARRAKELLFARLGHSVETYYCIVHPANAAALKALGKLPYARRLADATRVPDAIALELWRAGTSSILFELKPSP
ncbi:MAG: GNAT family N-acetyltransferase, partial [Firmicutes bacterium]|nr:GNAT family N-acetyltransferase [Bacillota bacterium]